MAADLVAMLEKGAFSRAGSTCFIRVHYHGGAALPPCPSDPEIKSGKLTKMQW
jgi:hypothetical protein